jgi:hypothetical protein
MSGKETVLLGVEDDEEVDEPILPVGRAAKRMKTEQPAQPPQPAAPAPSVPTPTPPVSSAPTSAPPVPLSAPPVPSSAPPHPPMPPMPQNGAGAGVLLEEAEENEVDEPLPMELGDAATEQAKAAPPCSAECSEALFAIGTDCWDISSWMIFLEEVQMGRGGDVSLIEAYRRILEQFPRSAKFWKNLAELQLGDIPGIGKHIAYSI